MVQDRRNALAGIDILRKICNHPDLLQRRQWESTEKYGDPVRSGKLVVALKVRLNSLHLSFWHALGRPKVSSLTCLSLVSCNLKTGSCVCTH